MRPTLAKWMTSPDNKFFARAMVNRFWHQMFGRGLVNYGASETARILRKPTAEIEAILGYIAEPELIHRDNLVVL